MARQPDANAVDFVVEALEVCFNMILYQRNVYPVGAFHRRRRFDMPVRMAKHPELAAYIGKVLASMRSWLLQQTHQRIALVIFIPAGEGKEGAPPVVLERFVFDIAFYGDVAMSVEGLEKAKVNMASLFLKINMLDSILSINPPRRCTWTVLLYTHEFKAVMQPSADLRERQKQQEAREQTWREWVPEDALRAGFELTEPVIHTLGNLDTVNFAFSLKVEEGKKEKDVLGTPLTQTSTQ
jgi:mitotic spindle assembly checkpoint protein MAD2B